MEKDVKPSEDPLTVVNKCVENLEKLVNLKANSDRALYVSSIEKLQSAVCNEETAMKHFVSSYTGGIPLLVSILEKSQDHHIRHVVILIMEKMLLHKPGNIDNAQTFVIHGAVDQLLKFVVKVQQAWGDEFVCTLYRVTAKVGEEDKKFAVKARFLGVLPVIVSHIRAYAKRYKVLNTILRLLKKVMASSVNATKLSKDGLPRELLRFLDAPKKSTIMPVLEAVSEATRARHSARQFVKEDVITKVLQILLSTNIVGVNKTNAAICVCKTGLRILLHLTQIKIGREKLVAAGAIPLLLGWCQSLLSAEGSRYESLVSLVSTVVQRCLPARPLPVRKLSNPVNFVFSDSSCMNESDNSDYLFNQYQSTEGRNDDTLSLASTLSSAGSGTDSEDEVKPYLEQTESQYNDCIQQFYVFFDELKELQQANFASGDDHLSENSKPSLCERTLPSPVIELKDAKPSPQTPKNIHRHSSVPTVRKDLQRKSYRPHSETLVRDRTPRSSPLGSSPSNSQVSLTKLPRKCPLPEASNSNIFIDPLKTQDGSETKCHLTVSEKDQLFESAKEERKNQKFLETVSLSCVYEKQAASTIFISEFVKLAYPDVNGCSINAEPLFKLLEPDPTLLRKHIYKHTEQMTWEDLSFVEVYSLDGLLTENIPNPLPLSNNDEECIYSDKKHNHLLFESRFESGNLRKVFWTADKEYDLILNPDINSKSHLQWFYFEVSGMEANCSYTFNIINMEKSTSQFNEGMCPVMFSVRNHVENKHGWIRVGTNICYFRNHYTQGPSTQSILRNKPYYTLTFTVTFPYTNDVCYFAYHYPYTYTTLQSHLYCWLNSYDKTTIYFKHDELCKTLSGNSVPLLTITSQPVSGDRPYIFLTGRVHPGESNASWVMKGTLDFLLCNKPSAQRLRETYIFKIVPMLNPDGVINGCHRCSLTGQDLNRQWITPNVHLHPTIFYTKALIHYLSSKNRKPQVFCDYHGHSRRSNVFFFGCNSELSWWPNDETKADCESYKILPILMHHMAPAFSLDDCQFTIERSRESTGRVTVWRQFDVPLSYTMECSYGGCDQGLYAGYHIGIPQLEETGMKLCQCFGKLVVDLKNNHVWSSVPIELTAFPIMRSHKPSRSKLCNSSTSSESDDEFEDCDDDDDDQFM